MVWSNIVVVVTKYQLGISNALSILYVRIIYETGKHKNDMCIKFREAE